MNARKEEGVKSSTVNREKAFLSCMLSCAVEWDLIDHNPLQGLKSFKEPKKRDIDISGEQIAALMNEIPMSVFNIIEFACYTGFRLENILSLRIEEIQFHDLTLTAEVYREVKGGRTILFPLGECSVEVLKRVIVNRKEGYVFINPRSGTRYKSIQASFNKGVRKVGLTTLDGSKLRFHDLRHVFSNWLCRNGEGASLDQLRPLLGLKDRSTTDRYVTVNRSAAGKVLSLLPNIRKSGQKNSYNSKEAEAI
ncbi:tyrosine-type recombinase/integrase [Candidatus Latescibacterota bacterium]